MDNLGVVHVNQTSMCLDPPKNRFKPSIKIFLLTVQGGTSFVEHLCYLRLEFVMLSRLFIDALW